MSETPLFEGYFQKDSICTSPENTVAVSSRAAHNETHCGIGGGTVEKGRRVCGAAVHVAQVYPFTRPANVSSHTSLEGPG